MSWGTRSAANMAGLRLTWESELIGGPTMARAGDYRVEVVNRLARGPYISKYWDWWVGLGCDGPKVDEGLIEGSELDAQLAGEAALFERLERYREWLDVNPGLVECNRCGGLGPRETAAQAIERERRGEELHREFSGIVDYRYPETWPKNRGPR